MLAVIAWLIATVLRAAATKALAMTNLDEKLSTAAGVGPMSRNVGNVLFWLVLLMSCRQSSARSACRERWARCRTC